MDKKYDILRKKMANFNIWEAENLKGLSTANRLEQFFALYELGQMHDHDTLNKMHQSHLNGIIKTGEKLRKAKIKPEVTTQVDRL
jgi:hypothetical protein